MNHPIVSCIILNYNGLPHVIDCLKSITNQDYQGKLEIIVVDNHSLDQSIKQIQANYPKIKLIQNQKNLGYAAGMNTGAKKATGDVLVFLNNDLILKSNWVTHVVKRLSQDKSIAAVNGCTLLVKDGQPTNKVQNAGNILFKDGHSRDSGAVITRDRKQRYETRDVLNTPKKIQAASGVALAVKLHIFKAAGGFDETFFMYYEDIDLSLRCIKRGFQIWYQPLAVAHHHHAKSSGQWSEFFIYETEKNRLALLMLHFPLTTVFQEVIRYKGLTLKTLINSIRNQEKRQRAIIRIKILLWLAINVPQLLINRLQIRINTTINLNNWHQSLY